MTHTTTQRIKNYKLKKLQNQIEELEGLEVKKKQEETSYPTDSLVVNKTSPGATIPWRLQKLVKNREIEIVDADHTNGVIWVIPHRGHGSYYKDLHPEDRPSELHALLEEVTDSQQEVKQLCEEIKKCADFLTDMEAMN